MQTHSPRLVIFGCGYIGTALALAAQGRGMRVTALTRNVAKATELRSAGVAEVVVADLAGSDWHQRVPTGPDFAVNCVSSGGDGLDNYRHAYVDGMHSVLNWAAQGGRPVGTLLYTSSTSVYPQGEGAVVDESADTVEAPAHGQILLAAEKLLRAAPTEAVGRRFILRLAGLYGPGRHMLLDELRAGATELSGAPMHRLNLAHRDDVVAAVLACLQAPAALRAEIFNVADGSPATKAEVVQWLCDRLERATPAFSGVGRGGRHGGALVPDRIIDAGKLRRVLGWRPLFPSYREGYGALLGHQV